jgi:hypothetical protein
MSVRRIKNHGTWVWEARAAYRRLRKAAFRPAQQGLPAEGATTSAARGCGVDGAGRQAAARPVSGARRTST